MKKTTVIVAALLLCFSCTHKKADQINPSPTPGTECDTTNVTFSGTILPILQENCALSGCHNAVTQAGGYAYEDYDGLMEAIQNGRLLGALNHEAGYVPMPKNAPALSDCAIQKITHWIAIGAPNN